MRSRVEVRREPGRVDDREDESQRTRNSVPVGEQPPVGRVDELECLEEPGPDAGGAAERERPEEKGDLGGDMHRTHDPPSRSQAGTAPAAVGDLAGPDDHPGQGRDGAVAVVVPPALVARALEGVGLSRFERSRDRGHDG